MKTTIAKLAQLAKGNGRRWLDVGYELATGELYVDVYDSPTQYSCWQEGMLAIGRYKTYWTSVSEFKRVFEADLLHKLAMHAFLESLNNDTECNAQED